MKQTQTTADWLFRIIKIYKKSQDLLLWCQALLFQRNKSFRTSSIPEDLIAKGTVAQKCSLTLSLVGKY